FKIFQGYQQWFILSAILNIIIAGGTLAIPALSADLIDSGIIAGNLHHAIQVGVIMLIAGLIAGACEVANAAIAVRSAEYASHTLRVQTYEKIQSFSFGNIDTFRTSDLLVRLTTDIQNIKIAVLQTVMNMIQVPLLLIGTIITMMIMAPELVWIMFVLLFILTLLLIAYFVIVQPAFTRKQEEIDSVNKALKETLSGIRVVKAFVRQDYEINKYKSATEDLKKAAIKPPIFLSYLVPTVFAIAILGFAAVYYFGGTLVIMNTGLMIGDVTSAAQYILILMTPLMIIAVVLPYISQANSSLSRIYDVLDAIPEIKEPDTPVPIDPQTVKGQITFDNVSFGYKGADGNVDFEVLSGINLEIKPGETVGFLGATGSGKSTLVSLIPRFYDVTSGNVLIDGVDVRLIPLETLRDMVSFCLQETVLFSGSIRDSIRFGAPKIIDDDMFIAARAADVDGFVQNIPEQYEGRVAQRGSNFSGGQRQRISIARALAKKPRILILDDSTSACDVATEARIQDAISELMQGVTKFIVAQRISSVITADRIVLLKQGKIDSLGTHAELLRSSPLYQEIYESQLGNNIRKSGDKQ
ncbi:MAG TPA: ABC transporter ATP-binding protein, partial [Methanospirillum sp.]|nr:ABC transporter ATP-binding protein [Methanospirillum sp.]